MYGSPDFDQSLIYSPDVEFNASDKVPWIHRARRIAQVLGPNCQDNVGQAVQANPEYFDSVAKELGPALGLDIGRMYDLYSWISYFVGKGDANCGNWYTWAALVIDGNREMFEKHKDIFVRVLSQFSGVLFAIKNGTHPELKALLDDFGWYTHFSATRIPVLSLNPEVGILTISWPGDLSQTQATPPEAILFLNTPEELKYRYVDMASSFSTPATT